MAVRFRSPAQFFLKKLSTFTTRLEPILWRTSDDAARPAGRAARRTNGDRAGGAEGKNFLPQPRKVLPSDRVQKTFWNSIKNSPGGLFFAFHASFTVARKS